MGSFHLMIHCFADIMQETRTLGHADIQTQFSGKESGELRYFHGMLQYILSVAGTIVQFAKKLDQLRVNTVHADFQCGGFPLLFNSGIHFFSCLLYHLLDSGRMNAAIHDELLERNAGDFTTDRIKPGDDDCFRRVINDEIHTGHRLKRADIAPLTPDDPSLHFVVRKLHNGDRCLGDIIGSASLNRADDQFLGLLVGLFLCFRFHFLDHDSGIVSYIFFNSF